MPYSSPINFDHGTTGLSVTAAVYESDKTTVVSGQSSVSLSEFPASSGQYSANLTLSSSGGYVVVNDGTTNRALAYDRELSTQSSVDVVDAVVDEILVDTAEIGAAGAGLTAVTLAAGSITSATFANNAIDHTVLATNAIGNAQLATSAINAIQSGLGTLANQTTILTNLADVPTLAEFEARTLPSANYFDPATDPVATVTTLTNLPSIPANWLTASGLASDAVAEIQSGLATTANQTSILAGLTDIKGPTFSGATDSLEAIRDRGDVSWTTATGFSTHTAADVWAVGTRTVTGGTIDTNLDMRGTDNALLAVDYIVPDNTSIGLSLTAAQAAAQAAQAMADGESGWDASTSTGYIKNADGTARKTFDLKNADGEPADPSTEPVAKRIPRP